MNTGVIDRFTDVFSRYFFRLLELIAAFALT
jgi:hypothetical protein